MCSGKDQEKRCPVIWAWLGWREVVHVAVLALCGAVLCGLATGESSVTSVTWFPHTPSQGDVVHIIVETSGKGIHLQGRFLEHELSFFTLSSDIGRYHAITGIDYSQTPGTYQLCVQGSTEAEKEETSSYQIHVQAKEFSEEHLTLPEEKVVLSPKNQKRVQQEQELISRLFSTITQERFWHGSFMAPVTGKMGSPFGMRRSINQLPRSPHSGQDVKAPEGTPVACSNRGKVALMGDFFFGGKSVFVDHGEGIYTMYFHLADARVNEGTLVEKGDILGWVGSTGRASGPHLHWGARIKGARVDPLLLIKITATLVE